MHGNKNYLLLFLIGVFLGIMVSQSIIPRLETLFFSKSETSVPTSPVPLAKEKVQILCEQIQYGEGIEVDLSQQKARLCKDGKALEEFLVSTGKKETPTPTGNFGVIYKTAMIYSKLANAWMPLWVGFYEDYGFHELPISEEKEKRIGIDKIGQPDSIGCIRLNVGDAEKVYHFAEIETRVTIFGQTPK